jgi:hypothetical protein
MAEKRLPVKEYLEKLVRTRPNDAVKLAFMGPEDADRIGRMELGLVSEIKRNANGSVEIKLVDKAELLSLLNGMYCAQDAARSAGANFYEALDRAAGLLSSPGGEAECESDEI